MNNGTRKGGDPDTMKTLHLSPGLEDLWQMHFSLLSGQEYTVPRTIYCKSGRRSPGAHARCPNAAPGSRGQCSTGAGARWPGVLDQGFRRAGRQFHRDECTEPVHKEVSEAQVRAKPDFGDVDRKSRSGWRYHHAEMANPLLIRPVPAGTPPELAVTRSHFRVLPYDLLKEASNRLGVLSLLAAALWVIATVLDHIAMRAMGEVQLEQPAGARPDRRRKRGRLPCLVLVFAQGSPGSAVHPGPWSLVHGLHGGRSGSDDALGPRRTDPSMIFPMITWVGAVILMFAAIVPNSPTKTLIASCHCRVHESAGYAGRTGSRSELGRRATCC